MRIPVMLADGKIEMVSPERLERLIFTREAISFRRSRGWVVIGRDPVRGMGGATRCGCERRRL